MIDVKCKTCNNGKKLEKCMRLLELLNLTTDIGILCLDCDCMIADSELSKKHIGKYEKAIEEKKQKVVNKMINGDIDV